MNTRNAPKCDNCSQPMMLIRVEGTAAVGWAHAPEGKVMCS